MNKMLTLKAPLPGFLMPLERVPDPVFAQKMVGDGIAIDPVSQSLVAPALPATRSRAASWPAYLSRLCTC